MNINRNSSVNNGKRLKKVSLLERVCTIRELKELLKKGILPLVIVLNSLEYDKISNFKNEWYYETQLIDSSHNEIFMILNIEKLEKMYFNQSISLDKYIKEDNNPLFIRKVNRNDYNNPTTLELSDRIFKPQIKENVELIYRIVRLGEKYTLKNSR